MVELRNDVLSEATRLFYERRRLQSETLWTNPSSEQEHFERLLRIEEMTSLLDAMTGGYFSRELERMYASHPELNKLWEFSVGGNAKPQENEMKQQP